MNDSADLVRAAAGEAEVADQQTPRPERNTTREGMAAANVDRAKEQRLAARGDRILDALATLIARWGFGKTTVDDIAREAGVAKGTVYLHWPSKGAMLHALIEREEQQWSAMIATRIAADPDGTLSNLYRHTLLLCVENPLLRALLTQDRDALGEWTRSPQSRERSGRRVETLYALLRELRAAGLVRTDLTVEVQAHMISALSYGILTIDAYMPAGTVPPFEQVADAFAAIVRRSFEQEPSDGEEAGARARGRAAIAALMNGLAEPSMAASPAAHQPNRGHAPGERQHEGLAGDKGDKEDIP